MKFSIIGDIFKGGREATGFKYIILKLISISGQAEFYYSTFIIH